MRVPSRKHLSRSIRSAEGMLAESPPRHEPGRAMSARLHLVAEQGREHLFDVESGRVSALPPALSSAIRASLNAGDARRAELIASGLGILSSPRPSFAPPKSAPTVAISLAIAQKCNLGCTYCYAQQGGFGSSPKDMPDSIARAAVDRLLGGAKHGDRVTLGFMGGEPLSNRKALHAVTRYAAEEAAARGIAIGFTLTTNGTLLASEDIALFQHYAFTLTVSADGHGATHDALRPFAGGRGSFAQVARNVRRLVATEGRRFRVLARVTVTPENLDLPATLRSLLAMGFDSVMFAPLLNAPSGKQQMKGGDFAQLLEQLGQCADMFRSEAAKGRILPLANVITTLQRIHHYRREHYPCGAGGGYVAASADGGLFACHRFVDDEGGYLGDVLDGISPERQARWLHERNLQSQSPCPSCWARYLCSGSCHYEVLKEGRPACDYIRGWVDRCLALYVRLARDQRAVLDQVLAFE